MYHHPLDKQQNERTTVLSLLVAAASRCLSSCLCLRDGESFSLFSSHLTAQKRNIHYINIIAIIIITQKKPIEEIKRVFISFVSWRLIEMYKLTLAVCDWRFAYLAFNFRVRGDSNDDDRQCSFAFHFVHACKTPGRESLMKLRLLSRNVKKEMIIFSRYLATTTSSIINSHNDYHLCDMRRVIWKFT